LAPFRSISVLIAGGRAWINSSIFPASSRFSRMQLITPWVSSDGVVRPLRLNEVLRLIVEPDQIGKCAADIDATKITQRLFLWTVFERSLV